MRDREDVDIDPIEARKKVDTDQTDILAKWPPITSLLTAFIFLLLACGLFHFITGVIQDSSKWRKSLAPVLILLLIGIVAFWWLVLGLRIICRWLLVLKNTGIYVKNDQKIIG